jgi:trimethylamine--corrinoid protein Co-methyltransferase
MHASLLGFSLESLIIDNDIIGATQRTIKGIEVNEEKLSFETIKDVCLNGPGHYLGSAQTLELMQTEYLYPAIGDRRSPNEWTEQGSTDALQRAAQRVQELPSPPVARARGDRRRHPSKISGEAGPGGDAQALSPCPSPAMRTWSSSAAAWPAARSPTT